LSIEHNVNAMRGKSEQGKEFRLAKV